MVDTSHDRIGQVLDGKYVLEDLIGQGGMGKVYRARHLSLDAPRAIKIIRRELAEEAHFVERFRAEALMAETLRHPNLVTLHDFASLPDGTPYIVWEFVEGETVREWLSRGESFTAREVVHLASQIADGLAAAHERGILHRDVSSDNVMIRRTDGELRAKVLDFGVAKMSGASLVHTTGSGLLFGKIGYLSPEQIGVAGNDPLDGRTDVFSLGVLVYEMLVGRRPFRNDTVQCYLHDVTLRDESEIQTAYLEPLEDRWRSFFLHALARDRELRTASMTALKRELQSVLDEDGAEQRLSSRPRRGSWTRAWPFAVIGIAGAGAAYWGSHFSDLPSPEVKVAPAPERPASPLEEEARVRPMEVTSQEDSAPPPAREAPASTPTTESTLVASGESREEPTTGAERKPIHLAKLIVRATPEASVTIDGSLRGITPLDLDLAPGLHEVILLASDRLRWRGKIDAASDSTTVIERKLDAFGALTVVADLWAEVSLDGAPSEQTPVSFPHVGAGLHELRVFREGFRDQVLEVLVTEGETHTVSLTMERQP